MPRQVGFLADQRTMVQDAELAKGLALRDNVDRRASPAARGSRCVQSAAVSAAPVGESMPSIKCCGWQRSSLHPPRKGVRQGVRQDEPGSVARRRNIPCGVAVEWAEKPRQRNKRQRAESQLERQQGRYSWGRGRGSSALQDLSGYGGHHHDLPLNILIAGVLLAVRNLRAPATPCHRLPVNSRTPLFFQMGASTNAKNEGEGEIEDEM